ncbi:30S ribosomal protein S6 [Candidatus Roizmanbacteria bacterium RIFCSPHIGHO2_02_FULL_37_15]|uniref:Small ribosomal subunit protein bS6 n=1 Tax=Candidatus Roizmanbacteria bacterium RIFCSPLOWO2_01_FULL_37_16 TaxID=1802058 RepID=A0A1F7IQI4_9BACT|nr:MAG: 30S ribosomal protein S6 [Candidatus Roizmanbacteria bacterium RIFCSPHIGHO2_01_FULL_37_16b]OGK21128.1 MAG: 30S ribosomal protein S6 [Candidatus Roizmanbacteria bacterium RIFCSPHIGHO2_02_FULL_37_15]OGK31486.1 MAG: 30S ribosomal protein S6 [Candidatus Roizmanbacteria bacterium RIFCSPHIGHO2_12_FULL_36_11]OGK45606.1 MAG: 30S ribosomal protein S6 [Candidatus Roizmanbacteria bacterium RIFCSPLOWO2_01_FULL_37_16]OGK56003.1 MAG: 30S ribosomal protein S6 [Candidatus Roizmanbacteria bacterium RIFC
MPNYELTLLLSDEEELKNIKDLINSLKGKIEKEEKWGGKTLAYPIKKNTSSNYYHWLLNLDQNNISELKKKLNFNEKLIRYLLLKMTR